MLEEHLASRLGSDCKALIDSEAGETRAAQEFAHCLPVCMVVCMCVYYDITILLYRLYM